jgi:hypothetical protein
MIKYFMVTVLIDGYLYTDTISTYSKEQAIEIIEHFNPTGKIVAIVEF